MLQIGKVAHLTGLSSKAIKWYEEKGLIRPTRQENQYRMYGMEDIRRLNEIRLLRQVGVSLESIQTMTSVEALLTERLHAVQQEINALQRMEQQIKWMQTGGDQMNLRYETWSEPRFVNGYQTDLSTIPAAWERLLPELATDESYGVCLTKEEAYVAATTDAVSAVDSRRVELTAGRYLVATVEGGIPAIPATYQALLTLPDLTLRDAVDFERYIHGQDGADDVIEVWLPVE